jgi:hypothetical protein
MLRTVREVEPPRPSTKLTAAEDLPSIAANRSIEPTRLAKLLQGELDWVVMKALEKDRTRRYDTVNGLPATSCAISPTRRPGIHPRPAAAGPDSDPIRGTSRTLVVLSIRGS